MTHLHYCRGRGEGSKAGVLVCAEKLLTSTNSSTSNRVFYGFILISSPSCLPKVGTELSRSMDPRSAWLARIDAYVWLRGGVGVNMGTIASRCPRPSGLTCGFGIAIEGHPCLRVEQQPGGHCTVWLQPEQKGHHGRQ